MGGEHQGAEGEQAGRIRRQVASGRYMLPRRQRTSNPYKMVCTAAQVIMMNFDAGDDQKILASEVCGIRNDEVIGEYMAEGTTSPLMNAMKS